MEASKAARRKIYVLLGLIGLMSFTSVLLLAMRPEPAAPDTSFSLMAADSLQKAFDTREPVRAGHWRQILVHHSRTPSGNAATLAEPSGDLPDHFVIGNGDGCREGEIQVGRRWDRQLHAGHLSGADHMDAGCISICLVGDFDHSAPTPGQIARLQELVAALRLRLNIPTSQIWMSAGPNNAAGVGRYFPQDTPLTTIPR